MKIKRNVSRVGLVIAAVIAFFLALFMIVAPVNRAFAMGEVTAGSATSQIIVYLQGKKTSNKLNVPVEDSTTASPSVSVVESYSAAYSIDYTLKYDDEQGHVSTVYTKTTTISTTQAQGGQDSWTLDVEQDAGSGYGTYILTSKVNGTGKQTDSAKWRYAPIWVEFVETGDNSDPKFMAYYEPSKVKKARWTLTGGRLASPLAGVIDLTNEGNDITIPLADYTLDAGNYTLTVEGMSNSTTRLGYAYSTALHYTGSTAPPTPDTNGNGDGALLVAAGAAVAVSAKKRRNQNGNS